MTPDELHTKNFLTNHDWFDNHFWGFFTNENKSIKFLNKPQNNFEHSSLSARVLTHWQSIGILDDTRENSKGWRKFSFSEQIWIKCIIRLRGFGMDLKKIKRVKHYLESYKSDKVYSAFPELDFYITYAVATGSPVKLIVFSDGESLLSRQHEIDIAKQLGSISEDFISIDINNMFNEMLRNKKINTDYLNYSKSKLEKEVYDSIYFDDINEVKISTSNGIEYHLDKSSIVSSEGELKKLINKYPYGEAVTKIRNHKKIHIFTEKKKVKK
jgi:DNA-binding transcriptional MerR regulator